MITNTASDASQLKANYNLGYVWLISSVAAMGGLLFGWDWVVIGGAKPFFQRYFDLTSEAQIGWANSCALIGCLVGALMAGAMSDKFGRKRLLILSALVTSGQMFVFAAFCVLITISFVATGRTIFPMIWGEPKQARTWPQQRVTGALHKLIFLALLLVFGIYIPPQINSLITLVAQSLEGS